MNFKKIFLTLFSIGNLIYAGSIIREFEFPAHSLKIEHLDGYSLVGLKGCDLTLQDVGKPIIPFANLNILIPPSAEIINVEILGVKRKEIPGEFLLYPAQPPRSISYQGKIPFVHPDESTYQLATEYPKKLTEIVPSGSKSGFRIGGVFLYPLQYIPKEKKLILYERIKVKVNYDEGRYNVKFLSPSQRDLFKQNVEKLIINPEDIDKFSPPLRKSDNLDIDYIILTDTSWVPKFSSLVNWIRKSGLWVEVRTTQWVDANYIGRDLQEKIREFIKDYFDNQGLKYILLAGGMYIVPIRTAYGWAPEIGGSYIPCDLYYADLDWSWDGNNNDIFGEQFGDTVDLYYDLYMGRWPCWDSSEVDTVIKKLFTYTKNPDTTYQKRILLPAAFLWEGYNHRQSQDSIANLSPAGWTDRVIDQGRNTSLRWQVRDSLNHGFGFCHLVGHGSTEATFIDPDISNSYQYLFSDPQTQTNYNKLTIVNSIACHAGDFRGYNNLARRMITKRGCAISVIMNSREGWGSGTPSLGPSEELDVRFYHYFFTYDSVRIAHCHQASKEFYRNLADISYHWRWCYYALNLLGEPSMMVWKDYPKRMVVTFPSSIVSDSQNYTVTVHSQGNPVPNALVCLWKGSEVFEKEATNTSGQVSFTINPLTSGYMYVTVTAKNKIPFEDSCQVIRHNDVGVSTILEPTSLLPRTARIPIAKVKNFGFNTATNFLVKFTIDPGGYLDVKNIGSLTPGSETTLVFAAWTPIDSVWYRAKCTTLYALDEDPNNDMMTQLVAVYDYYEGFNASEGNFTTIPPSDWEWANGRWSCGWYSNISNSRLNSCRYYALVDSPVVAYEHYYHISQRDGYNVKCSIPGQPWRLIHAMHSLGQPYDTVASAGNSGVPSESVYSGRFDYWRLNWVTIPVSVSAGSLFWLRFHFGSDSFNNYFGPLIDDVYGIGFADRLPYDVGVTQIITPPGTIDSGVVVIPQARIKNFGTIVATSIPVTFKIGTFYTNTQNIPNLNPGDSTIVGFTPWTAVQRGTHTTKCTTALTSDQNPANNALTGSVTVRVLDVGVVSILAPSGAIDSGATVTPQVKVKNFGNASASFPVWFRIYYTDNQVAIPTSLNKTEALPYSTVNSHKPLNEIATLSIAIAKETAEVDQMYEDSICLTLEPGDSAVRNFRSWTAIQRGTHTTKCTTALTGDVNPANNSQTGSVTVRVRDIGVIQIVAPTGTVDSGVTIVPQARIQNFGSAAETFPVTFKIGTYYNQTRNKTLSAGAVDTVNFPSWTAIQRGTHTTKCSTALTGDLNPVNDTLSNSVTVRVKDVGVTQIIVPSGTVDSGAIVTPLARVKNYGTQVENFPVTFRIGTFYTNTQNVNNLASGDSTVVSFALCTLRLRGTHITKCTTALTGDLNPANNALTGSVTVQVIDVGVVSILAPSGIIDSGATVTPQAKVKNFGNISVSFPVTFRIGSFYADTFNVSNLNAGDSVVVSFRDWSALQRGTHTTKCSTALTGDANPSNNCQTGLVTVRIKDVGVVQIVLPSGIVDSGTVIIPQARIQNYGNLTETFPVIFKIGTFYNQTRNKTLSAGVTDTVNFPSWTVVQRGFHTTRCSTALAGDVNAANDTLSDSVIVRVRDVGVTQIIAPFGTIDSGTVVIPQAIVKNYGDLTENFPVTFRIGISYTNTQNINNLNPGDSTVVSFDSWIALQRGTHITKCTTALTGDLNPANNALSGSVMVRVFDVGVTAILSPVGTIDSGATVIPRVKVKNFGNASVSFPVWFRIHYGNQMTKPTSFNKAEVLPYTMTNFHKPSNEVTSYASGGLAMTKETVEFDQVYEDSIWLALAPADSAIRNFDIWIPTVLDTYTLESFTSLTGDMNSQNDTVLGSVIVRQAIHDVGVIRIITPTGTIDSGTVVIPKASVQNFGVLSETFLIRFRIGTFYTDDTTITLAGGIIDTVDFASWTAIQIGTHITKCTTLLYSDTNPANDFVIDSVRVRPGPGINEPFNIQILPKVFALDDNTPNPFISQTLIRYALPKDCDISLQVYNSSGILVRSLKAGTEKAGFYRIIWNGNDDKGKKVVKGVYFYRLEAGEFIATKKMVKME